MLFRDNLRLSAFADSSFFIEVKKDNSDKRYNFTLKYEDFEMKVSVKDNNYFCIINEIYISERKTHKSLVCVM